LKKTGIRIGDRAAANTVENAETADDDASTEAADD
jgi:hypothetical protein